MRRNKNKRKIRIRTRHKNKNRQNRGQIGGIYLMKNKDKRDIEFEDNNITWECGRMSKMRSLFGKKNCPIVIPIENLISISELKTTILDYDREAYERLYGRPVRDNWREFNITVDIDGITNTYLFKNNFTPEAGKTRTTNDEMEQFYNAIKTEFDVTQETAEATRPRLKGQMN